MAAITPLAWQSLGSATTSVTFSSIPSGYRDLYVVAQAGNSSSTGWNMRVQFNGDSTTSYYNVDGYAGNTTLGWTTGPEAFIHSNVAHMNAPNAFGVWMHIQNYSTTQTKPVITVFGEYSTGVDFWASTWNNTAVLTSITMYAESGSMNAGSTFALYGVSA